ncbi:hypothetical protein R3P38DRAFT_2505195 [Favolaschia claudopus]|uniref:WD40 repeat-like protein n=1 Tax=Favolaschia claudopus TaxID=2862362 RepID=A0AAW0DCT8_9AGAR
MPPRPLPGFYFDQERNRYFPLTGSGRLPAQSGYVPANPTSSRAREADLVVDGQPKRRRRPVIWNSATSSISSVDVARHARSLRHSRIAATSSGFSEPVRWPFGGESQRVSAFRTTPTKQFFGDTSGWLYSRAVRSTIDMPSRSQNSPEESDTDRGWTEWTPELSLAPHSEISALCTTDTCCVAVCFGPTTKICVQDAEVPGRTQLLHLSSVRDVRAASLKRRTLVLGAADKVVHLADLDRSDSTAVRMFPTRSDVFTVAQQENFVYAGTRAGTVLRFDTRINNAKMAGQVLFESGRLPTASDSSRSSAVFVHPIHGGQSLVAGYMDGRFGTYDLRFLRPMARPSVTYAGQTSSHGHCYSAQWQQGITLDPSEHFLFAAGLDHRIRAWDVDSGELVSLDVSSSQSSPGFRSPNLFAMKFATHFSALQIVDAEDGPEQILWASGGSEVWSWRLGV